MELEKMTGLEMLQAMARGDLPRASITEAVPMTMIQIEEGAVLFHAIADKRHFNPLGLVHGGFASVVLDSVTGCAVHTLLGANVGYSTIDLHIKMVRPIPQNEKLVARGKVINMSRSLGLSEGTLERQNGKLLATATATCMILR